MVDIRDEVTRTAESYDHDFSHARNVAELSESIFDLTTELHGLGQEEKEILTYAALLHDIGWSGGQTRHHKRSFELIHANPPRGLTPRQTLMIANIARYHRKGLPKLSHTGFSMLKAHDRETVRKLSALIRIADGLDALHDAECHVVDFRVAGTKAVFVLQSEHDCRVEIESAKEKADLFREVFDLEARFDVLGK
jgi:exopolyphosphatase/guanosine-5'-triphosphate,3'-diphosphate pyrophosphatase